jgi:hypothetical protein
VGWSPGWTDGNVRVLSGGCVAVLEGKEEQRCSDGKLLSCNTRIQMTTSDTRQIPSRLRKISLILLLALPYLLYIGFIIRIDRGPVDYETFMDIGARLYGGEAIYGENSYYPMPFVIIFSLFSWLPRPLSMALWMLLPVIAALIISEWSPYILLFAPTFGHFLGGQTSVFSMLGLWGYRRDPFPQSISGGIWLAVMTMKPQLAIIPIIFASYQWWKSIRAKKRIPRQVWGFILSLFIMHIPGFLILPDWPLQWLRNPRPLFERALSGLVPRTLQFLFSPDTPPFWILLSAITIGIFLLVWIRNQKQLSLDLAVMAGFVISPFVHDYDLLQIIPLLETSQLKKAAALLSIPGWFVILFFYATDPAWYAFTIIALGLLWYMLKQRQIQ